MSEPLWMYVIYRHPLDAPESFVVRRWRIGGEGFEGAPVPEQIARTAPTLEAIRASLPPGLFRMERSEGDDPCILESWL